VGGLPKAESGAAHAEGVGIGSGDKPAASCDIIFRKRHVLPDRVIVLVGLINYTDENETNKFSKERTESVMSRIHVFAALN
jgi:hypothetical protein